MAFLMLPEIDAKTNPLTTDNSGSWVSKGNKDFLNKLADSLVVEDAKGMEFISSIPDVWARPLLFKMALFGIDAAKPFIKGMSKQVEGEWRSLLAMFALKDVKHVNLKVEYVDLAADDSDMAKVLKALIPRDSINADKDAWLTDIYIIYFNDKPIAMTSPSTLITSAADYVNTFGGRIPKPWSDNGNYLTDPINGLQPMEREALDHWLRDLHKNIQSMDLKADASFEDSGEATELRVSLLNCIARYIQDINVTQLHQSYSLTPSHLNLNKGVTRLINNTVAGKSASISDSQVRLMTNPARSKKKILLVSPKLVHEFADQENIEPSQLVVWPGVNADNVTEDALRGERNKIGSISLNVTENGVVTNVEYRRPEDFFYDKLAVIEPGNSFPGSLNNKIAGITVLADTDLTPILPIKNELLEYFTPAEIADRMSISEDNDNIYIYFNFPLSGKDSAGANYRFCQTYPRRQLIYIQNDVPVVEMWPNIQTDNWNKYYLYYENYLAINDKVRLDDLANDIYFVKPWSYGKEVGEDFKAGGHGGRLNRFTAKLDSFPEVLICSYKSTDSRDEVFDVGVVLMDIKLLDRPKANKSLDWQIGVDFGTSSTMLYFRETKSSPSPLILKPRLFHVTESKGALAQLFENFIPNFPYREDGSFLSVFHLLQSSDNIRPLIDGHVFLLSSNNTSAFVRLKNDIDANLKWKGSSKGKAKTAAYIGQICLQALVEAAAENVENITWNFSYPTAFSPAQQMTFDNTCRDAVSNACDNTNYTYNSDNVVSYSESEASAYYFNKLGGDKKGFDGLGVNTNFAQGAMCIDIGAGTTDITIISGQPGRIIYHTSIQYAGRYMFKPIYDNYSLIADSDTAKSISEIDLQDFEQRQAVMDAAMRDHSQKYIKDAGLKIEQENIKSVLQASQLAVSGLFYYLGILLGKLHSEGHYGEDYLPRIFVGGNGSRILKWLTLGNSDKGLQYLKVLETILIKSANLKKNDKFYLDSSANPKIEVASGMITDKPHHQAQFFDEEKIKTELFGEEADQYVAAAVLAGAEFIQNGKSFSPEDFISAYDVSEGITVKSVKSLKQFLKFFNSAPKLWSQGIDIDDGDVEEIIRATNAYFVSEKGKNVKDVFLEPVFIIELKKLMEMLNYA